MQQAMTRLDLLDGMVSEAARRGIAMRTAEDESLDGRTLRFDGRELVNFGSCSYLGLEVDPRLKQAAVDAAMRYGTLLASSRVYVSAPLCAELEELLEAMFGGPVLLAPTTTLAHLSTLPTLIHERDAVVLDHQVHNSVQMAAQQLRAQGTHVELVRHSRMDLLDERVRDLSKRHRHVWYLADGVYSMFGDFAPVETISSLLDAHEQLHFYVDDAHGTSWCGRHGRGYVLSRIPLHPRMVLATGLGKGFGTGGGVVVFPNAEQRRRVRTCGGPMLFSGPLQPPVLGAAIASARIHLSDEIDELQARLRTRIDLCNELLSDRAFPVLSSGESPVRFAGMGATGVAQNITARLMNEGYFTNVAQFPATPTRRAGCRFMLNPRLREDDLRGLASALDHHFPLAVEEEGESIEAVWEAFGLERPQNSAAAAAPRPSASVTRLRLERETSIDKIPARDWDRCLGAGGAFTWESLRFLEETFHSGRDAGNDWRFHYYRVLDEAGETRLATFFTDALWKADMLAPAGVSRAVERERGTNPLHLTSRVFAMGSLLTEGNHLYLRDPVTTRESAEALMLLLDAVRRDAAELDSEMLVLRDLPNGDADLDALLCARGFARTDAPEAMTVDADWRDEEEFFGRLSRKSRQHQRRQVLPWKDAYRRRVWGTDGERPSRDVLAHFHELYRNVKQGSLALNTFDLPGDIFERFLDAPGWELLTLERTAESGGAADELPVAVVACYAGTEQYVPTVIGLDYRYVVSQGLYRQSLRHMIERARELGLRRVVLGMGAEREKRRFSARSQPSSLWVQADDHFALDAVAHTVPMGEFAPA